MSLKVLIVDDDKDSIVFFKKGLERQDMVVTLAFDGRQAKDAIEQDEPDVIVLDLMMPVVNGWEVLRWLREDKKMTTPTIILSAQDDLSGMKKGASEAETYLVKPVDLQDLLQTIHVVVALDRESGQN